MLEDIPVTQTVHDYINEHKADLVYDRAAAYYRLRKELRKADTLTAELNETLSEQWWEDVKGFFGHGRIVIYWDI